MNKPSQKIDSGSPWMDYAGCSRYTGISEPTLKRMVRENEIPHSRPANRSIVRFHKTLVDEWLLHGQEAVARYLDNIPHLRESC